MKKLFEKYREIIVYILVGLMATVISYGIRLAMIYGGAALLSIDLASEEAAEAARASALRTVSTVTGSACAIVATFWPNKIWVFRNYEKERSAVWAQFGKFVGSRIFSFMLELGIAVGLPLLLTRMGYRTFHFIIDVDADKMTTAISIVFITVLNYILSKLLVFRKKKSAPSSAETAEDAGQPSGEADRPEDGV